MLQVNLRYVSPVQASAMQETKNKVAGGKDLDYSTSTSGMGSNSGFTSIAVNPHAYTSAASKDRNRVHTGMPSGVFLPKHARSNTNAAKKCAQGGSNGFTNTSRVS